MTTRQKEKILEKFPKSASYSAKTIFKLIKNNKYRITDERVMEYAESPTGRAFVGISKRPLQIIKNGYGFKGVLLQTDNRMLVQCHICGKWMRKISGKHLGFHNTTKAKYQEEFGLYKGNALISDATSYKLEAAGMKRVLKSPETNTLILANARPKALTKTRLRKSHILLNKTEHENRYAICEKQLGFRLLEYIKHYRNLPSRSSKNDGNKIAKAMFRRYGSLNEGFKHYGVPTQYRQGTNIELIAQNGKKCFYNYNKFYNREEIYNWMLENSPVLQPQSINLFNDYVPKTNN